MDKENYKIGTNLNFKVFFSLLVFIMFSVHISVAQNVYGLEPIQVVGQMNGYSTASGSNSSYRKVSVVTGNPTDGRGQWFKTYNVQSSGGDFTPRNMTGGGGSGFLFISGPSSNRFANKWVFSGVGQGGMNVVNTCNAYNSGNDMGLNMNTAGYYSFVFNDAGYTVTNAKYYVAYTTSAPINVTRTGQSLNFDRSARVDITTSASPSAGENIYVRFTTSSDFSNTSSSSVVQATGSGTSWTASIPAQAAGSTVRYFVFSSTVSLSTLNSMSELDKSLSTLKYDDNSGSNYSYTLTNAFVSVASGNFADTATWGVSQIFSGASYTIANTHTVTLSQDMTVSSLTINSGGTFDNSNYTLNISANGNLNNNGAYSVTTGKLNFVGAGTLGGSQACSLNDLTINSGTLTLSQVPTINGTLLINGGNVSAAPIYGSASTLAYNITYNRFNEWSANGTGSIGITAGYPNNVEIRSGTFEMANSSTTARSLNGNLTINTGAICNISSANMTLNIGNNLTNNGVFTATNGTVIFPGNCVISGNASSFNNVTINGNTTLSNATVNGILNFNAGASIVSGTISYGSASTLKYNSCPASIGAEWPSSAAPFNITLASNAGTLTLNGSKTINGSLNIGSSSTLDVSSSHFTINIGNNGSVINNGTFNAQSGLVAFAGAASVTGTISFYDVSIAGGVNFGTSATVNNRLSILPNGYVNTNPCTYAAGSTLIYNNGSTYVAGSEWLSGITTGAGVPFHVQVGNGNANSALSLGNAAYTLRGNLTLDTSSGSGLFMGNSSSVLNIAGDFINNGNNVANLNPGSGRIHFNGTSAQNISGSNSHSSAFAFNSVSLNNTSGLVLNKPISVGSNGILTLTNGTITTDLTNSLNINNTNQSAISGASGASYINGPISRALPSNNATSSSYLFPVGKGANYLPLTMVNPKTGAGAIVLTASAENANSNGTAGAMLSAISNTEYWHLTASGNFNSSSISLARSTSNGIFNTIARSTSLSGTYSSIGGTASSNSILNSDTTSGSDQYFVLGSLSVTTINSSGGIAANPGTGSSGYFGSTITISGTQLAGITELRIGGANGRIIPIVSQTDTSIVFIAQDTSGLVYVTDGVSSTISSEAYTHLGYISNANGDWNTASTWLGNTIPPLTSSAYVKDSVDLSTSINQSKLVVITNGKLHIFGNDTLNVLNFTNNGKLYIKGALSILDYSINNPGGVINCEYIGSVILNDSLINHGSVLVDGALKIMSFGRILTAAPVYSSSSNLFYSSGASYARGIEWSGFTRVGYPNHITVNNGTTLNIGTLSSAIALAGNLNLGDNNGAGNLNMQSANQFIQINGNLNIGSNIDTSTLTLSNSIGGDIKVAGNWTRSANGKFVNNTRAVFFIGSGLSEINGNGGAIFDYFISQKTSSSTIRLLSNVTVLASASGNVISLSSGTVVDLNGYNLNLTNSTSSNILVDGGNASFTGIVGSQINFTNGVKTITSTNNGSLTFGSNVKLIANNGGINFGVGLSTVNGSLQINSGGYVLNNPCIYGIGSTLVYNTTGTYTAGTEWVPNLASGTGVPYNLTVSNNTNLSFGSTNQYRQVNNDITIANGSTLSLSTVAGGDVRIKGNWKNDNITVGQGLIHNNRAIILNGVANQSMTNESNVITIGYLLIDKPNGTAILNDSLTLNGTSAGTAQVLQLNNVGSLDLNGNVLTIAGNQVRSILCNASRLITGATGSQLIFPSGTGVALIEGAGTLTLDSNINVSIYKGVNFGLNKTTIRGTLSIYPGSFCSSNSPLYGANANLIYNTGNYTTSNEWTLTNVPHNIHLNLSNTSNALSLSGNKQVSGILNINNGNVLTNNDTLFMNAGSTLNKNNGYVIGNLAKYFDATISSSNTFEIGTSLGYTPINVSFPSINTSGFVTCKSNDSDYAMIASSGLKPAKSVNRNWLISSRDVAPVLYNVFVNYLSSDNDNGVALNFYKASIYNGSVWSSKLNPTTSPSNTNSNFSGISSFGNLQIGEDSTVSSLQTNIQIIAFLQGLYQGSNIMTSAPFNSDGISPSTIADTIQVELHEANPPYSLAYTSIDTISTNGIANVNFPGSVIGSSYYIVLKHRNSVATWSSVPVLFTANGTSYDFSSSDTQAYGNNLVDDGNGVYLIFTGDINQDGSVDFNDYPDLDISSSNGDLGYLPYDLNGDASVDFNDYPLIDINSSNGIFTITP